MCVHYLVDSRLHFALQTPHLKVHLDELVGTHDWSAAVLLNRAGRQIRMAQQGSISLGEHKSRVLR